MARILPFPSASSQVWLWVPVKEAAELEDGALGGVETWAHPLLCHHRTIAWGAASPPQHSEKRRALSGHLKA